MSANCDPPERFPNSLLATLSIVDASIIRQSSSLSSKLLSVLGSFLTSTSANVFNFARQLEQT